MSDLNIVEVVPVIMEKHPNADSLSIVRVFDGYNVVVRTEDWKDKVKGAYIPPDNVVPEGREEFAFLGDKRRIKAMRLRGVMSQGLLVPVPDEFEIGQDVTEYFGVTRYVPQLDTKFDGGDISFGPSSPGVKYDLQSWFKYRKSTELEGVEVVLTEKLDGTSLKVTWQDEQLWVSSRSFYRKEGSEYWRAVQENPWIVEFCKANPGVHLHGEIFGWVQKLRYGATPGQIMVRAFDVYDNGVYWNYDRFYNAITENGKYPERVAPIIWRGPHDIEVIESLVSGNSTVPSATSQKREGVVIRPVIEIYNYRAGRLCLKAVSPEYLADKNS